MDCDSIYPCIVYSAGDKIKACRLVQQNSETNFHKCLTLYKWASRNLISGDDAKREIKLERLDFATKSYIQIADKYETMESITLVKLEHFCFVF